MLAYRDADEVSEDAAVAHVQDEFTQRPLQARARAENGRAGSRWVLTRCA